MAADDLRRSMWAEACAMLARAEGMHRQFFQPAQSAGWEPPVDVFETERELWIIAALPGVAVADLDVAIDGQAIRIAGVRRQPDGARGAAIRRLEIPYGRFERSIVLQGGRFKLDRSELESGCLFIRLSKLI